MLHSGLSAEDVAKFLNVHISTVYRYAKSYSRISLSDFIATNYNGYWGNLSSIEISVLRKELKQTVYTDAKSIAEYIYERFCVRYTAGGVVDLLNRIGFTYKKTKEVPCERNIEKQQSFATEMSRIKTIRRSSITPTVCTLPIILAPPTHG